MTLTIDTLWQGRTAEEAEDGSRRYVDVFQIRSAAPVNQQTIMAASGLPAHLSPYPADPAALLRSRKLNQRDDPLLWFMECVYDTKAASNQDQSSNPNPLLRPPEHQWGRQTFVVALTHDMEGTPIVNSAGDPFVDPPIEVDRVIPVLTVARNIAFFSGAMVLEYSDTVNSDPWFGCAPGQARLVMFGARSAEEQGQQYWQLTAEIQFKYEGWRLRVLNAGYQFIAGDGEKYPVTYKQGPDSRVPFPLNEDGSMNFSGTPIYKEFKIYREIPFGPLNLV